MNDSHPRRAAILFVLVLAILAVGFLYFLAKPAPSAPVPPAAVPNPPQSASTSSSTQPKITWSQNQLQVILAPTESASSDLTFVSSLGLSAAVVEPVPAIAPLLSVQPSSFTNLVAGAANAAHVSFAIPASTTLGTYTGTIHVRIGNSTLPQTLKIGVDVWQRYTNASLGMTFLISPGTVAQPDTDGQGQVIYIGDAAEEFSNGITVTRHTRDLTTVLSDITTNLRIASQNQLVINGQTWTIYDLTDPSGGPEFLDAFTTANGAVYQVGGKALSVADVFSKFLTTISFE